MPAPHAGVGPDPYNQAGCQPPSRGGRASLAVWDAGDADCAPSGSVLCRAAPGSRAAVVVVVE